MPRTPHDHVEHVLASTTDSGDLAELDAHTLEQFLWYELPAKWSATREEQDDVVSAIAEALAAAGRERLAARCTSPETKAVLDAWDQAPSKGFAACRRALARSPSTPPDIHPTPDSPGLVWGSVMGVYEATAQATVGAILGAAYEDGFLRPRRKGWRAEQQRLAREALARPAPDALTGGTLLDAVIEERLSLWSTRTRSDTATSLLTRVGKLLLHHVPPPDDADAALEPLRHLLGLCVDGVALTATNTLNREVVRDLASRFGWALEGSPPRAELDEPLVRELHDLVKRAGLARRFQRTLRLTSRGRDALADLSVRWQAATEDWIAGDDFYGHVGETALALLVDAGGSVRHADLVHAAVALLVEQGWATGAERVPVDDRDVGWALGAVSRRGRMLGLVASGASGASGARRRPHPGGPARRASRPASSRDRPARTASVSVSRSGRSPRAAVLPPPA